jgi:hypothetical protein
MMNIEDIPSIPDREQRLEEITVDCYDEHEVLSAFEVYLSDALLPPEQDVVYPAARRKARLPTGGCRRRVKATSHF